MASALTYVRKGLELCGAESEHLIIGLGSVACHHGVSHSHLTRAYTYPLSPKPNPVGCEPI